jgi:hypothetical protein
METKLNELLQQGKDYMMECSEENFSTKRNNKWSKKEMLGHLIDSGIHNLLRITEVQFEGRPYPIRKYRPNESVVANNYQHTDSKQLINFWLAVNYQLLNVIALQTEESLCYQIKFETGKVAGLRFLIEDYIEHLEHHLNQIRKD